MNGVDNGEGSSDHPLLKYFLEMQVLQIWLPLAILFFLYKQSECVGSALNNKVGKVGLKSFYLETHGCQMNLADSDIVRSVLLQEGYTHTEDVDTADLILTNTCAIR